MLGVALCDHQHYWSMHDLNGLRRSCNYFDRELMVGWLKSCKTGGRRWGNHDGSTKPLCRQGGGSNPSHSPPWRNTALELPERMENRQIGGQRWKMYSAKNKKPLKHNSNILRSCNHHYVCLFSSVCVCVCVCLSFVSPVWSYFSEGEVRAWAQSTETS